MPQSFQRANDMDIAVRERYAGAALAVEPALCCPVSYDDRYLKALPKEIIEKDYGCGDPTRFVEAGESVLDLGSGAGKICYMLSQKVGATGKVIGVDFNDPMLKLARSYIPHMADQLGYANVHFVKGRIQDLALDLDMAQAWLETHPVRSVEDVAAFEAECARLRAGHPLIEDASIDVVVSNCVLNLVQVEQKKQLFREIRRVLRPGGRAVISDIVCDEAPPSHLVQDPELWSGCISGAFREDEFLEMFEQAGFYGCEILVREKQPWQVVDGFEFRSMTVRAFAGKEGPCLERNQAVVYRGPWKKVIDDDGHTLVRGHRMAVCDKTYRLLTDPAGPYSDMVLPIPPRVEIPLAEAAEFPCHRSTERHPRETKGQDYAESVGSAGGSCEGGTGGCC